MIGEVALLPRSEPPDGIRIVEASDVAGVDRLIAVHEEVFGEDHSSFREQRVWQLAHDPGREILVLALAGDKVVCAARAEFPAQGRFASLWGGGTLPAWRGRGIYRAMVSYRAGLAAARGYEYLHVDASDESRPILERLGFVRIARTTPYVRVPAP